MVDVKREQHQAARRLMEVLYGHSLPDDSVQRYAKATIGDLVERLDRAERQRDAALAHLAELTEGRIIDVTDIPAPRQGQPQAGSVGRTRKHVG